MDSNYDKRRVRAIINRHEALTDSVYSMWLDAPQIAKKAKPGQFLAIYVNDSSKLLPRPISICETDKINGRIRLVYRIAGSGTAEMSKCVCGDSLMVMGPLGNGFPLNDKAAMLVGGGIGIPPLLELAKNLKGQKTVFLGYRDSKMFLREEFEKYSKTLIVSTDDGSFGIKGNVIHAIETANIKVSTIYACGPVSLLHSLKMYAIKNKIECWISLEERMACSIGACLGCVCPSKKLDEHSNVYNKRVCKDGPVFLVDDVEI